ncbi:MAG: hypothetical protein MZV63_53165 [Marinilabiliales bacterium]|nr:hypothetical protein [Marinilabiliales bacterium]
MAGLFITVIVREIFLGKRGDTGGSCRQLLSVIFTRSATDCHGSWSIEKTYEKLSANVDTVTPSSSEVLSIHSSITAFGSAMIQIDTVLISAPDMIMLWASQGAQNN